MHKHLIAVAVATGLIAAPLPSAAQSTGAQTTAAATTTTTTTTTTKPKRQPTPGQLAARERQKKCAAEWNEAKASGKIEKGMKWPQYWSACNKRLKSGT